MAGPEQLPAAGRGKVLDEGLLAPTVEFDPDIVHEGPHERDASASVRTGRGHAGRGRVGETLSRVADHSFETVGVSANTESHFSLSGIEAVGERVHAGLEDGGHDGLGVFV